MSLLYTTFSGTYVRTVRTGSYAHDFKSRKSEVGIEDPPRLSYVPGSEIVASAESRKRVHEEEKNKKDREETRERKGPSFVLFPAPPTFSVPFTLASPTLLHVFPTISTI